MPYLQLIAAMMIVGAYVGFSKLLVALFPVVLLAWLRFGIAGVAMLHWLRPSPGDAPLDARLHGLLFLEALFGNFLFSLCMLAGMRYGSALMAGVIMAAIPAIVALLSWLFLRERLNGRTLLALVLAVLGIGALAFGRNATENAANPWLGGALLLAAAACEASYVVIGKRLSGQLSPRRISALVNAWGLLLVTPLGLWAAGSFAWSAISLPQWGGLVLYALAASVWTVWLWMKGLQRVPASRAGIFTVFLPLTAALVGVLFLGEQFTTLHAFAFGCALLGVLLATWPQRRTVRQ